MNYVFRDPADKECETWRVWFNGNVLSPCFNSRGAALAHLERLSRAKAKEALGEDKP